MTGSSPLDSATKQCLDRGFSCDPGAYDEEDDEGEKADHSDSGRDGDRDQGERDCDHEVGEERPSRRLTRSDFARELHQSWPSRT
jgi:hypothetical protein